MHFLLVTVARQRDKHALDNRARKLVCHPRFMRTQCDSSNVQYRHLMSDGEDGV